MAGRQRQPRRTGGRRTPQTNVTTLALEEYWGTTSGDKVKYFKFIPGDSKLSRLDALGSIYEQYRIRSLSIRLAPIVGMTSAGSVVAGWFYDFGRQPSDYAQIAMCSPHAAGPIWSSLNLTVPARVVMRQQWYSTHQTGSDIVDSVAGGLAVITDGGKYSTSVWVKYVVDFQGPTLAKAQLDQLYAYDKDKRAWQDEHGKAVKYIEAASGDFSVDLQVDGNSGVLDAAWQGVRNAFQSATELHRIGVEGLYYARIVAAGVARFVLPTLTHDAVVHIHPDPFRLAIRLTLARRDCETSSRGLSAAQGSSSRNADSAERPTSSQAGADCQCQVSGRSSPVSLRFEDLSESAE